MEDILRVVKRINQRLAVYEKQGLTNSAYYNDIINSMQLYNLPMTTARNGKPRLSRAKNSLVTIDENMLAKLDRKPALKEERERLKKQGIKKKEEQNEKINVYGYLKTWAEENLEDVYTDTRSGYESANIIENAFDSGKIRNMTYSDIRELIDNYEREKKRAREKMQGSKYWGIARPT